MHTTEAHTRVTAYAGAIAFATLLAVLLPAFHIAMDLLMVASTNVHVFGTFFLLAASGVAAWGVHGIFND